jgi:hypothetical protein
MAAASKSNGFDYSACTFRWLWQGTQPGPVQQVIQRILLGKPQSFGYDPNLIQNVWTGTVRGTGKTEAQYFANRPNAPFDICCADTVGFCAYQTGLVDDWVTKEWIHVVSTFFPTPWRKTTRRLVGVYPPGTAGSCPA